MLSESSLNNGIDYLSQNFLAPCSLEAMQWIASKISPQQNNNDIMVEMMLRIIEGNFGDAMSTDKSEQIFTSRMILNAISPRLLKKLKSFTGASATENIEKLSSILVKETNVEYCQYVDHPKHESSLMGDTMTNDLLNFLKKSKLASTESISEAWLKIKYKWRTLSANEACFTLLQQIEHNLGARGSMAYEDSKFIVDFFMFMITGSSSQDAGDISSLVDCLNCARPPKAPIFEAGKQFALTINDHHSSIFNENASTSSLNSPLQEENPRLREELMGDFEMGDLFEDMSEGFFDELMTLTNDPASSKPFVDVSDVYKQSVKHLSLLWRISECMVSPEFLKASSLISIARASLIEELRKWSPRL
ncbi:hypothetical protein METBIDRAFT_47819 [Metschnikowia bicuspidata var. bicuspidata NRRL YB-4993]|uniref:Mediator of RNA polymerase II transcription subunit 5 n=1 Tax=Metschnikowia bicuspidata var. bicuspidata NRRL YB-4993 TaxID=869754 RepID=A0A1A0H1W4_9ASCO|nr:hypothetical protein METBIDRAFT_47819 [Metschnikowia bicuspidata var. bicuspidata NRRL YB-4993]OBA17953.1 hypothetical protein METBIDRAFT_47819 [Metschnikowia bicuspidata var. bicuspidata NRRL YB-4993]